MSIYPSQMISLAENYSGLKWCITSITTHRYKDTGEKAYCIHLCRRAWDGRGDREATLMVTINNGVPHARPIAVEREGWSHYRAYGHVKGLA